MYMYTHTHTKTLLFIAKVYIVTFYNKTIVLVPYVYTCMYIE